MPKAGPACDLAKFPGLSGAVVADAGIEVVLPGVRMPGMNAVMERWILTCRRELPGRTLICRPPPGLQEDGQVSGRDRDIGTRSLVNEYARIA